MRLMTWFKPRAHAHGSSVGFHNVNNDRDDLFQSLSSGN